MSLPLISGWTISCASNKPVVVIPADKYVVRLTAGTNYTPKINGWFVPDSRMLDIFNKLPVPP